MEAHGPDPSREVDHPPGMRRFLRRSGDRGPRVLEANGSAVRVEGQDDLAAADTVDRVAILAQLVQLVTLEPIRPDAGGDPCRCRVPGRRREHRRGSGAARLVERPTRAADRAQATESRL